MLSKTLSSIAVLSLATSSTAFTFHQSWGSSSSSSSKCTRGGPGDDLVDGHYFNLGTGCRTDGAGKDQSMLVTAGNGDYALVAVFFSSDDCNPETIIATVDETYEANGKVPGCWEGKYGSFEVWSVCENNALDCL
ncbi:hypothetical protein CSOJ01_08223 [Colletotrichum sojae]|uniref:Uncharacterized protein n=1 Tax=Colletotrichum sojae TaxID=2175907 RepID=A0A8H6J737_9PEZI|nr:hypothetical protein CSOJ01_08223 [Colletotrichum sojae]